MKKIILSAMMLISFFVYPVSIHAAYIIHLKQGGQFVTPRYWEEDGLITFFVSGGTMGIEKGEVRTIEKSKMDMDADPYETGKSAQAIPRSLTREGATLKETAPDAGGKSGPAVDLKEEKVDLQAYQEKMNKLKSDINKTLARMKKAEASKDQYAKDEATEENKKISEVMWKLTEELKAKNKGQLPADWWEGVGREEK